jgi:enediyne biosynthesis protein E4
MPPDEFPHHTGDYDNDGYLDLFVVNDLCNCTEPNFLFHNNGDGTLSRMTNAEAGSSTTDLGGGGVCAWGDFDNDGYLDLFVPHTPQSWFYHNNGDGTFTRILSGSLVNDGGINPVSCAWGDYDNDGFLDLIVTRGAERALETNLLYHNNGNSNAWIKVRLVGTASNRSAVGAKVRLNATIRGKNMWQLREINTGSGFGASPLEAHFGLGDATNIDQLRIEWPSGIVQTLTNVAPRQTLTVVEHQPHPGASPAFAGVGLSTNATINLTLIGSPGAIYLLEASTNLVNWTKVGVRSNATGSVVFVDLNATNITHRYYRASAP